MSAITCSTALWNHKEYFLKKGVARARARSFRFFDHSEEYEKKIEKEVTWVMVLLQAMCYYDVDCGGTVSLFFFSQ